MAVVLSAGCLNQGDSTQSTGFVADVTAMRVGAALECHKTSDASGSLDWRRVSHRFSVIAASFGRAANTTREEVAKTVQRRSPHVAAGLRSVKLAASSTLIQSQLTLIVAARPAVFHFAQCLFAQPGAASGVLWDDRRLLDEVSRIA